MARRRFATRKRDDLLLAVWDRKDIPRSLWCCGFIEDNFYALAEQALGKAVISLDASNE